MNHSTVTLHLHSFNAIPIVTQQDGEPVLHLGWVTMGMAHMALKTHQQNSREKGSFNSTCNPPFTYSTALKLDKASYKLLLVVTTTCF